MFRIATLTLIAALSFLTTEAGASAVGIRLVFEEQLEGVGCTQEEHNTVVSVMHDGVLDMMEQQASRMLYNDDGMFNFDDGVGDVTDPSWCRSACKSHARGTCFVAYPPCDETRRFLSARPVSDPAEFARLCVEEEDAVLSTIREGVAEVSESCNALLQTKIDVTCTDLSKESPVFVPATSSSRPLALVAAATMMVVAATALV